MRKCNIHIIYALIIGISIQLTTSAHGIISQNKDARILEVQGELNRVKAQIEYELELTKQSIKHSNDMKADVGDVRQLKGLLQSIDQRVDTALSNASNLEKSSSNNFFLVRLCFGIMIAFLIGTPIGLIVIYYRYMKQTKEKIDSSLADARQELISLINDNTARFDAQNETFNQIIEEDRKSILKAASRFYNHMAYSKYNQHRSADKKAKPILYGELIEYQEEAVKCYERAFGLDLEKMQDDDQKFYLLAIWQNLAFYYAMVKNEQQKTWAVEKASIAYEYAAGIKPLKLERKNIRRWEEHWADTYFYVLMQYDLPEYKELWLERYDKWCNKIEICGLDTVIYEIHREKLKGELEIC